MRNRRGNISPLYTRRLLTHEHIPPLPMLQRAPCLLSIFFPLQPLSPKRVFFLLFSSLSWIYLLSKHRGPKKKARKSLLLRGYFYLSIFVRVAAAPSLMEWLRRRSHRSAVVDNRVGNCVLYPRPPPSTPMAVHVSV